MAVLNAAAEIEWKLLWLREHPGKTRRDYNRGLSNGEVWKWRRAKGRQSIEEENAAWLRDHLGPLPEHLCSLTDEEYAAYDH